VAGDEKDVIRKIRLGQYGGGGFTGVGIGEVAKKVRILDAPLFFRTDDEVAFIQQKYESDFEKAMEDGGFVLLGWAEVGFVYVFSTKPVKSFNDLRSLKPWMWEGDPIAQAAYQAIGVSPVPLSITDVMTSLQTGMIDTVYTSPYALIALQWFTRVNYAMTQPLADALGAAIVSKKIYDSLPDDLKSILLTDSKKYINRLTLSSRQDNAKAIDTLKQRGMKFVEAPEEIAAEFDTIGRKARRLLVGTLYSQEFLDDVESSLQGFRKDHPAKE
jgi:TRAP-type C4-dicarboxylate transport system substrate-binding protein